MEAPSRRLSHISLEVNGSVPISNTILNAFGMIPLMTGPVPRKAVLTLPLSSKDSALLALPVRMKDLAVPSFHVNDPLAEVTHQSDSSYTLMALQENAHNTQRHWLTYPACYVDIA
jgi:hypothetical protein